MSHGVWPRRISSLYGALSSLSGFWGLGVAWDCGFGQVVCYSDSMLVVSLISQPPSDFHAFTVFVGKIRDLLLSDWTVI